MMLHQPEGADPASANVIRFAARAAVVGLSLRDRMEIAAWQGQLRRFGYDRMVIHERISCDPPEVECFLSIYRDGEAWARWGLARCGTSIMVWNSVSGADIGRFSSLGHALAEIFPLAPQATASRQSAEVIRAFC